MKYERVRDRIWMAILVDVFKNGEVKLDELDASETVVVDSHKEVIRHIECDYLDCDSEDCVEITEDGEFEITIKPDPGETTKRSVLRTLSESKYSLLAESEDEPATWKAGPILKVLFNSEDGTFGPKGGIDPEMDIDAKGGERILKTLYSHGN